MKYNRSLKAFTAHNATVVQRSAPTSRYIRHSQSITWLLVTVLVQSDLTLLRHTNWTVITQTGQ